MVTIAMVASGSRGDVQPYIALGKGLKASGHDIRFLTNDNFETLVTEAGLNFGSIGESVEQRLKSEAWRTTLESNNFIKILAHMNREMKAESKQMVSRLPALLEGADLMITGMGGLTGILTIANHLHIPSVIAHVFPFTPTREFPSPLVAQLPFGKALNRLSFQVTHQMFWQNFKVSDAVTREMLGLGKPPFWGPFGEMERQKIPTLYGYSRHVLPQPSDWAPHHTVTGYWFLDEAPDWQAPQDLLDFLARGDAPVYIGFGSMGSRDPEKSAQIALDALEKSGARGVIASGWGGMKAENLPDTVHMLSSIPHTWLFPRMAAVVHHGGAGTTAAGLRAGKPSIIVPFSADQPFWGHRVAQLGVGTTPIPRKKLTSEALAQAIREALSNTTMQRQAHTLGEAIRAENGVENAVSMINRVL